MSSALIFANTVAEYESSRLLTPPLLKQIAGGNFKDAVERLKDLNYLTQSDTVLNIDLDALYFNKIKQLNDFLAEYSSSAELNRFLLSFYYYADAKALFNYYKNKDEFYPKLYLDNPVLIDSFSQNIFDGLPPSLKNVILTIDNNANQKDIDLIFIKAMHLDKLAFAKKLGKGFVAFAKAEIDLANILSCYRAKKLNIDYSSFKQELIGNGEIELDDIAAALNDKNDFNSMLELLRSTDYENVAFALSKNDLTNFKKHSAALLDESLQKEYSKHLKYGPLAKFVFEFITQIKTINYILVALKNNISFNFDDVYLEVALA